ncbi:MAG: hypothetical protein HRU70_14270 [Phycisphaeraceae bacterium]|nr:MAG: hypothetical protein HRU70_14270 [Phycisphaeraceae bacterium]
MGLIIIGIDEAGYGPLLGPLCVSACAARVDGWSPGEPAPDLWALLDQAVARGPSPRDRRIPLADSKRLKLPNPRAGSPPTRHPLRHLERGVLSILAQGGSVPADDAAFIGACGAAWPLHPAYAGEPTPLPVAWTRGEVGVDANVLASAGVKAGVSFPWLGLCAVAEPDFNRIVRDTGSKSSVTLSAIRDLLSRARAVVREGEHARVVCDRLGGRTDYEAVARELFAEWGVSAVRTLERTTERSRYALDTDAGEVGLVFQAECESAHLPVAAASMAAKYARELAMIRFNRYWCARREGLTPTAGYWQDAKRWLAEADDLLDARDRRDLVRLA